MQVSLPTQYNDQQQAPVGALSGALGRIQANRPLRELREIAKGVTKQLPEAFQVRSVNCRPGLCCAQVDSGWSAIHALLSGLASSSYVV